MKHTGWYHNPFKMNNNALLILNDPYVTRQQITFHGALIA